MIYTLKRLLPTPRRHQHLDLSMGRNYLSYNPWHLSNFAYPNILHLFPYLQPDEVVCDLILATIFSGCLLFTGQPPNFPEFEGQQVCELNKRFNNHVLFEQSRTGKTSFRPGIVIPSGVGQRLHSKSLVTCWLVCFYTFSFPMLRNKGHKIYDTTIYLLNRPEIVVDREIYGNHGKINGNN